MSVDDDLSLDEYEQRRQDLEQYRLERELPDLTVVPVYGGWQVRETEHYWIQVIRMGFNNRICLVPKYSPDSIDRSWCYRNDLVAVVLRCQLFNPDIGEEPTGWIKEAGTERRACAHLYRSKIKAHQGYDRDCPDCGDESLN